RWRIPCPDRLTPCAGEENSLPGEANSLPLPGREFACEALKSQYELTSGNAKNGRKIGNSLPNSLPAGNARIKPDPAHADRLIGFEFPEAPYAPFANRSRAFGVKLATFIKLSGARESITEPPRRLWQQHSTKCEKTTAGCDRSMPVSTNG